MVPDRIRIDFSFDFIDFFYFIRLYSISSAFYYIRFHRSFDFIVSSVSSVSSIIFDFIGFYRLYSISSVFSITLDIIVSSISSVFSIIFDFIGYSIIFDSLKSSIRSLKVSFSFLVAISYSK